jgi:hypothetical protein
LSEKAKNASESCHRKFFEILKSVLLLQRPLEEVIRSLHSFFEEAHSDGRARSVHLFNGTWNEASGEFLGKAAGAAGEPNAVTLVDFKEKSVVQTMCTAFAVAENFTGNQAVSAAIAAHKAGAVGFVNISPDRLPKKAEGVEESLATIRTEFTGMRDYYKNLVLVANHPVVREGVVWKRDNGHSETEPAVLGYPAFALLGKVHKLRWSGGGRCMTSSPIKPSEDHIPVGAGSWLKGLSCPYLLDQRSQLDSVRVAFLQESDNLRGDAIVVHFNTACTAFSGLKRVPFVLTLGRIWLERVVLHHLLQCAGAANTDFEARRIGRSLNLKLGTMSSPFDETRPFVRAWVDWESSRCVREAEVDPLTKQPRIDESGKEVRTGRLTHEHEVHVQYREGVEVFKVRVVPEQGV